MEGIRGRFDQPGFQVYNDLQTVLLNGIRGESYSANLERLAQYRGDINFDMLVQQLDMLQTSLTLVDVPVDSISLLIKWFTENSAIHGLYSEVLALLRLVMVLPATNAVSERSFSTLRRVKTYLRSVMSQDRLNSVMNLHVYKEETDNLDTKAVIKAYIGDSSSRASRIAA